MTTRTLDMANVIASDVTIAGDKTLSGDITFSGDVVPSTPLSHRNMIINGDFKVNQAGNKTGKTVEEKQFAGDRWTINVNGALGTWSGGIEADAPTGSGFRNSGYANCTTADASPASSDFVRIEQRFEGQDLQHILKGTSTAKELTVSFWVKSPNTGIHIVEFEDRDNWRYCSQSYTIGTANTWEYKTATFPADTTGALNDDNGESLRINFWLGAGANWTGGSSLGTTWHTTANTRAVGQVNVGGAVHSSNNYWQITGVQLELGDNATPFEHRSSGDELLRCQRYYQTYAGTNMIWAPLSGNDAYATSNYLLSVEMRATPTASGVSSGWGFGLNNKTVQGYTGNNSNAYPPSFNLSAEL